MLIMLCLLILILAISEQQLKETYIYINLKVKILECLLVFCLLVFSLLLKVQFTTNTLIIIPWNSLRIQNLRICTRINLIWIHTATKSSSDSYKSYLNNGLSTAPIQLQFIKNSPLLNLFKILSLLFLDTTVSLDLSFFLHSYFIGV